MWPLRKRTPEQQPPPESERWTVALSRDGTRFLRILTRISPEEAFSSGIPTEAIAGVIGGPCDPEDLAAADKISFADFKPNPAFSAFMSEIIQTLGPEDPELQRAAHEIGTGSVAIDLRTPEGPMGHVPLEDIVGIFAVKDGVLGDYHPNEQHKLFTSNGLVQLPDSLREVHLRKLKRFKVGSTEHRP
jgi:hypothetical protein